MGFPLFLYIQANRESQAAHTIAQPLNALVGKTPIMYPKLQASFSFLFAQFFSILGPPTVWAKRKINHNMNTFKWINR